MNLRSIVAVSVVGLAVVACGNQESATDTDGTWVGTITTEGNVTTVVNESGSVWGGTARFGLAFKPSQSLGIGSEVLGQNLDGDISVELRIPRPIHLSHAALTERFKDLVRLVSTAPCYGRNTEAFA